MSCAQSSVKQWSVFFPLFSSSSLLPLVVSSTSAPTSAVLREQWSKKSSSVSPLFFGRHGFPKSLRCSQQSVNQLFAFKCSSFCGALVCMYMKLLFQSDTSTLCIATLHEHLTAAPEDVSPFHITSCAFSPFAFLSSQVS